MKPLLTALLLSLFLHGAAHAGEVFVEAEAFHTDGGWSVVSGPTAKSASGLAMLSGATGKTDGTATTTVSIKDAGHYHVWVRYSSQPKVRGPFHVTALAGGRELGDGLFDMEAEGKSARNSEVWSSFDATLPEGEATLRLSKHENKNCSGSARLIDCVLLTMDDALVPNHLNYGAQTYVRFTLGDGYDKPAYLHIFADHFHAPWYQHYSLGREGAVAATAPKKPDLLHSGESSPWCNLTPMIYQDSGTMLFITARHGYTDYAPRLKATLEFATAPDDKAVVRTLHLDNQPGTVAVFMPPNLLTPDNLALFKTDLEIAEATGRLADAHDWPSHGRKPEKFPFFVTAITQNRFTPASTAVEAREKKTLDYFGFTPNHLRHVGGAWMMKDKSHCNPDVDKMQKTIEAAAGEFKKQGGKPEEIAFSELTDEPTGQPLDFAAKDPSYAEHFRVWLKTMGRTPADLLVKDWDEVKIVTSDQRTEFPALYYYSQRLRTRALGDFMARQREIIREAYGRDFPVLANFSDGAVYAANFYMQGVDYFELLGSPDQNAIWGEDWANGSSTYQCASFNVDLMRAATRDRHQVIGHHLVAHAGRKAWDIKLKATSELARGVKIFNNFAYGPSWATHEGGPYWRSSVWQAKPETWTANAAVVREVGAVEDMLLTAVPAPAEVALLYSSSSDIWTIDGNLAYGFDRMHTWLALTHAQMPVDVVSEQQVEKGWLAGLRGREPEPSAYKVCYLSGPNLTRKAAETLAQWVKAGGVLWMTAGAATRDEFNQPLHVLDDLRPVESSEAMDLQKHTSSGRYLSTLAAKDTVTWKGGTAEVLAVKQAMTPKGGATVLAAFKDQSPALVCGSAGTGKVYCAGFLPALAYIKPALDARNALQKKVTDGTTLSAEEAEEAAVLERTANPWKFPAAVRDLILTPVHDAVIAPPIVCDTPLVDAVFMPQEHGVLVPLANYTGRPVARLELKIKAPHPVGRVESVLHGAIDFKPSSAEAIELFLPLDNNDYLKLIYKP